MIEREKREAENLAANIATMARALADRGDIMQLRILQAIASDLTTGRFAPPNNTNLDSLTNRKD